MGEYNALLVAGAFDFETGLKLVQKRGELMAAASGGGMAAVLGLNIEELKQKLASGGYDTLDIANYNTPTQTVISGTKEGIDKVCKDFDGQGINIVPLFVTAPFHSHYMESAAKEFATFLKAFKFNPLKIPVIANMTARPYEDGQIAELLSGQISGSVQWTDTIRYLMGQGVDNYQELGRDILTKMVDEIRKDCSPIQQEAPTPKKKPIEKPVSKPTAKKEIKKEKQQGLAHRLGSAAFREDYGIDYSYVAGAMYRGTASKELVIQMGKAGMIGYLGTGGMKLEEVASDIDAIQAALTKDQAYGMNLLHHRTLLEKRSSKHRSSSLYANERVSSIFSSLWNSDGKWSSRKPAPHYGKSLSPRSRRSFYAPCARKTAEQTARIRQDHRATSSFCQNHSNELQHLCRS
jgi:trans-AT polyketide synthase/acyltransferase/oxidoreductase domain-containing protein